LNPIFQEILAVKKLESLKRNLKLNSFDIHISLNSLIASYFIVKKLKVPSVLDIYDDIIGWIDISPWMPTLLKPIGKIIGSFMLQENVKVSKKITYSTESLKTSYNLPESKSILIPNGVDTNLFYYRHNGKIKELLGINDDFVLGFVGSLEEWVDLETIFEAAKMLRNYIKVKIIIVGNGSKYLKFKNLSRSYGVQSDVIFTGSVPYSKVPEYISSMDVCLLPFNTSIVSRNALPIKLFEYMACERPVISSSIPGIRDAVGDAVLYFSNLNELIQNVLKLYYNEELRIKMGKKGRAIVKQKFSWDEISKRFEKVLIEVVEDERRSS
jgi:glycosyltransferase involved in cell wall biosynthesis